MAAIPSLFHSTGFTNGRNVAVTLALVFWLALAFWVFKDARRRIREPFLVLVATLLGLVPIVGPLVYLLVRPAEALADVLARNIELQALDQQLARVRPGCPVCSFPVEPDYLACPVCTTMLREPCSTCKAPLEPLWQLCPYCASPVELEPADLDAALTGETRALVAVDDA